MWKREIEIASWIMTGKFQGRHSIRSHVMSLLACAKSRINFILNPCQLPNINAKYFYENLPLFLYPLHFFFFTCSFLWSLICFCLVLIHFQMQDFDPSSCVCLWLNHGFHTYIRSMLTCVSLHPKVLEYNVTLQKHGGFLFFFFCSWELSWTLSDIFLCFEDRDMKYEWIQPWH